MTMTLNHTDNGNDLNLIVPEVEMEIVLHNYNSTSGGEEDLDLDPEAEEVVIPHVDNDVGEDEEHRFSNQDGNSLLNKRNVTAAALLGLCVVGFSTAVTVASPYSNKSTSTDFAAAAQGVLPYTNTKSSKAPSAKSSKTPKAIGKTPKSANKNTSTSPSVSLVPSMLRTLAPSDQPSDQPSEQPSTSSAPSSCGNREKGKDIKNLLLSASVSESDAINDESSPQGKAFYWITCEDCIDPPLQPGIDDAQIIQRYILAVFYYATNGPHWFDDFPDDDMFGKPDEYWMSTCDDECFDNWYGMFWGGVRCNEDRAIIGLWLDGISTSSGQIPTELGLLTSLEQMSLSVNGLTGSIPTQLGSLTNLTSLGLNNNELNGSIPTEIGLLEKVSWLEFGYNQITGTVPTELGSMTSLSYLFLHDNELSGSLPTELGDLDDLEHFTLFDNGLTGTIPSELGLTSLKRLYAYNNNLSGSIPTELGPLEMEYLWLHDNALNGTIPTELGQLKTSLKLQGNDLVGSIPAVICNKGLLDLEADCDICDASQVGCCKIKHGCP